MKIHFSHVNTATVAKVGIAIGETLSSILSDSHNKVWPWPLIHFAHYLYVGPNSVIYSVTCSSISLASNDSLLGLSMACSLVG